jgi:3-hydroxyisobutyrate dehydrogenase
MRRVAFFGLGVMGGGMAGRLLGAGFQVTVWNRTADRARPLVAAGATLAASPREAAADAEVAISMVADDAASRRVWLGGDGALAGARRGTIVIESSTVSPDWVVTLARESRAHGCDPLDAPVTGSRTHAASGELLFLVGGDAGVFERARPLFAAMGRDALHLGAAGSGARLKLVNNFLCGVHAAALAEALALVERNGLDRDQALTVLINGAPGSPMVKTLAPRMVARDYIPPHFALTLMKKDLAYAQAEAARHGVPLTTAAAAERLFDRAIEAGEGGRDLSAVIEPLR